MIHSGENLSNHSPIYSKLKLNNIDDSTEPMKSTRKVCWSKASEEAKENYKQIAATKLEDIIVPE